LTELWFYVPLDTKQVILETFPKPTSWLGIEKLNLTQQKHTFTNQKECTTTSGYATWFTAGGAIRIADYDVNDDVITRKL